ncbi:MAG: Asp-tRNA(Asn)/Glu-tRNA(Gln) amidotransferase GatCAB subunit A, partial [Deltaproteobacteria bacterium]|nr:Asp-tRNA(Asn)/Glu-tRNA(Gln) amidotransferase GatCAB subunit A [Deltaproteobacteria bacterium]
MLHQGSLSDLVELLTRGEVSSVEATRACLNRTERTRHLGAYLHVDIDGAMSQARAADARRAAKARLGALDG